MDQVSRLAADLAASSLARDEANVRSEGAAPVAILFEVATVCLAAPTVVKLEVPLSPKIALPVSFPRRTGLEGERGAVDAESGEGRLGPGV